MPDTLVKALTRFVGQQSSLLDFSRIKRAFAPFSGRLIFSHERPMIVKKKDCTDYSRSSSTFFLSFPDSDSDRYIMYSALTQVTMSWLSPARG